jgi:hypothetical protein
MIDQIFIYDVTDQLLVSDVQLYKMEKLQTEL